MRNRFLLAGIAAVSLATVSAANATEITGPYVDLGAGAVLTQTQHSTTRGGSSSQVGHAPGFSGFAGAGWGFGNGLRAEIEGTYLQSHVNRVSPQNAHGHDQAYGGLVNVLYDIDLKDHFGLDVPVTPYVGVGAGYLVDSYNVHGPVRNITGTQGGFAYQGIVGASIDTGVPGLQATVDYRMIGQTMSKNSFHDGDSGFDHKFNHTFNVGLRYAFDTAPAAPQVAPVVAAPAPSPARSYLVFFDWDKYALSTTAKSIISGAAQASTHVQTTKIVVNGYTDNTAIHQDARGEHYNLNLSIKRADAVKAELIRDGVPAQFIDVHGFGDKNPLVVTAPNTREAQNRRVEIILQ